MIPLRDVLRSRTTPVIVFSIIAANAGVFLYELMLSPEQLFRFFIQLGLVPFKLTTPEAWTYFGPWQQILPLFTSMFLHGGWLHIIGNMWTLFIFGDNVEDRMGKVRFAVFYLLSGLVAVAIHVLSAWGSQAPVVGASGAIAGVMGAYLVYFPRARIVTFVPVLFFVVVNIPAEIFLVLWFVLQFFNGAFALMGSGAAAAGIAWWAHIGGFLFGVATARLFEKNRPKRPDVTPLVKRYFS